MLNTPFYHSITRKIVVAFGNMFNNISLIRRNTAGVEVERMKVPIEYGPKQKWWAVLQEDPAKLKVTRIILPRIGFEIVSMQYDTNRQLNPLQKMLTSIDGDYRVTYTGTPYLYTVELNIMTQNSDDGFQIVEQILPYFTPTQTVSINSIPLINHKDDVPMTLTSVQKVDDYEGSFERLRVQTWSLTFNVRAVLYGPVVEAKLIRKAIVDIHSVSGSGDITPEEMASTPRHVRITTEPDPTDAEPEDDYGFSINIQEFDDNKRRDPVTGTDIPVQSNQAISVSSNALVLTLLSPTVTTV